MPKISRRKFLIAAGGTAAAAALAIGGNYYFQLQQSAKEPITVVQWGGSYMDGTKPIIDAFTSQYGIPVLVELHTGGAAAVIARIKADLPRVTRDVVAGWDASVAGINAEGWALELTPSNLPVLSEYPEQWYFKDSAGKVTGLAFDVGEMMWAYREDLVPKDLLPLDSVDKFYDSRLKGKIATMPITNGLGTSVITLAKAKGGDEHNMDPGFKVMQDLAKNGNLGAVLTEDAQQLSALANGTSWIEMTVSQVAMSALRGGADVTRVRSSSLPGVLYREGFQAMKGSPRLDSALKFMNFFFQRDNEQLYAEKAGVPATHPQAQRASDLGKIYLSADEVPKYGYIPDWKYVITQLDAWNSRWEQEIAPYVKAG